MIALPIKVVMGSRVPPGLKPMIDAVRRLDDHDGTERPLTPRLGVMGGSTVTHCGGVSAVKSSESAPPMSLS